MSNYPEIYVLRHGETEWNAESRMQGRLDSPLTEKGIAQARRQGRLLAGFDWSGFDVWCSPQGRAFQTAAIALVGHVEMLRTDDRLCEIDVGDWQGCLRKDLPLVEPQPMTQSLPVELYKNAPNGEGFARLRARCTAFLDDLARPAVIVTHGITSRMLRTVHLGLQDNAVADLPGGQGVVHHVKDGAQKILK
ncbi:histidine phosphatase family protein [Litoreibacter roseus]|uniref:Phosphoglycerate mutase n=1 Tax=Litoreibacter roseus TaxID=2601869 RepID=A0A6N6JBZ1_9RHOB|nr:histidine phosphatase family protein [Litoreibacter roseus]GFE63685.1 phosphoglycerate mutase [Litoreibacter roseus]